MMRTKWFRLAVLAVLAGGLTVAAQEQGLWRASNSTAKAITGDIGLSDEKISINFLLFSIARIRPLQPAELSSIFDLESATSGVANLYRLNISGQQKFLRKNSLCGSDSVTWMVAHPDGKTLHLAFFSGEKPPIFTFEEMVNATNRCGTFAYVR